MRAADLNFLEGGLVDWDCVCDCSEGMGEGARTMTRPPGSSSPFATENVIKDDDQQNRQKKHTFSFIGRFSLNARIHNHTKKPASESRFVPLSLPSLQPW